MLLSAHFPSLRQRGQPLVPKKWTWVPDETQARLLLKSVTSTNPKHGPGWIAAARVEEFAGKIVQASFVPFFFVVPAVLSFCFSFRPGPAGPVCIAPCRFLYLTFVALYLFLVFPVRLCGM